MCICIYIHIYTKYKHTNIYVIYVYIYIYIYVCVYTHCVLICNLVYMHNQCRYMCRYIGWLYKNLIVNIRLWSAMLHSLSSNSAKKIAYTVIVITTNIAVACLAIGLHCVSWIFKLTVRWQ